MEHINKVILATHSFITTLLDYICFDAAIRESFRARLHSALQQHLSSSVHAQVSMFLPLLVPDEISFHCPRTLMGKESKKKAVR